MQNGNVNGAIKILTNSMGRGRLPLNDETLGLLRQKHPEGRGGVEDAVLQRSIPTVNPIVYDVIGKTLLLKAAQITKGRSGPPGMDAYKMEKTYNMKDLW